MARGKRLSFEERKNIIEYRKMKMSCGAIAKALKRSHAFIQKSVLDIELENSTMDSWPTPTTNWVPILPIPQKVNPFLSIQQQRMTTHSKIQENFILQDTIAMDQPIRSTSVQAQQKSILLNPVQNKNNSWKKMKQMRRHDWNEEDVMQTKMKEDSLEECAGQTDVSCSPEMEPMSDLLDDAIDTDMELDEMEGKIEMCMKPMQQWKEPSSKESEIKASVSPARLAKKVHHIVATKRYIKPQPQFLKFHQSVPDHLRRTNVYHEPNKPPLLNAFDKENRLEFAGSFYNYNDAWSRVIFSDEKKFNLDGPIGTEYYWHDLRTERGVFFSSQSEGEYSVAVWGAFSMNGKSELVITTGMDQEPDYASIINSGFKLPDVYGSSKDGYYPQKNATLIWPSHSPDLQPMENLWGILARAVYANGKTYSTTTELQDSLKMHWKSIELIVLQHLISTMDYRCLEIIKGKGELSCKF